MRRMEERLLPKKDCDAPPNQPVFVLVGMGGVGKSETALQFVQKHYRRLDQREAGGVEERDEAVVEQVLTSTTSYWAVFWVDCSSDNSARSDFKRIADKCGWAVGGNAQVVNGVKEHLSGSASHVLIVLDNCDERNRNYEDYVPIGQRVSIVITGRLSDCEAYATYDENGVQDVEHFDGLDLQSGIDLIYQTCQIPESKKEDKRAAAESMVKTLEYHPLAIIAGASFIREGRCSLEGYPTLFAQRKDQMLNYGPRQMRSRHETVFATFEVSARDLGTSSDPAARDALAMLEVLAFMDRGSIGEDVFTRAWEYERRILSGANFTYGGDDDGDVRDLARWHAMKSGLFLSSKSAPDRICSFHNARAWLCGLSLARLDHDTNCLSMHSLVHDWARIRIGEERTTHAWNVTASILALSTEESISYETWSFSLQSHLEACITPALEEVSRFLGQERLEFCRLLFAFSWQLYRASSTMTLPALRILKKECQELAGWDENSRQAIAIDYLLALGLSNERADGEAEEVQREVVRRWEEILHPDDPVLLSSQHALARTLQERGQVVKAVEMLKHIVEVYKALIKDHPNRLASQHDLACAYRANGQLKEAIEILEHVVEVEMTLAEDNPSRLASQQALASAYRENGQLAEAVAMLEHVVELQRALAENHPGRLASQHELAGAYLTIGQVTEAVEILEHVVEVQKGLVENHPDRLASQHVLGRAYLTNEQLAEAVEMLEHVVDIEKSLPSNHPDRLISQYALYEAYLAKGCNEQAQALWEEIDPGEGGLESENESELEPDSERKPEAENKQLSSLTNGSPPAVPEHSGYNKKRTANEEMRHTRSKREKSQ